MYSDGEHSKEIERLEQMMRENTSEEREWKEDVKEVMEYLEEGDDDGHGNASARRTKEGEEEDYVTSGKQMLPDATTQGRLDVGTIRGF